MPANTRTRTAVLFSATCIAATCIAGAVSAQTINWTHGSGNWNDPANWTPSTVPASNVSAAIVQADAIDRNVTFISSSPTNLNWVNIDASGTGRVTLFQSQDTLGAATLSLGTSTAQFGIYNLSGGTLAALAQFIGLNGTGTIVHSAGVNQSAGFLSIGDGTGGTGHYLVSGSAIVNIPEIFVGYSGKGTLSISGGQILGPLNSFLSAGNNANSNGTILLSAGTISTQSTYIGNDGIGALTQNGGATASPHFISIGDTTTGRGTYQLQSGTLTTSELDVGYNGMGTFTQSGGIASISGSLLIAHGAASRGTLTIASGSLDATSTTLNANGTINFNGGALSLGSLAINNGRLIASSGAGKLLITASVTLSGTGLIDLNDNDMIVKGGNSYEEITGKIASARNAGSWNGVGITSTTAMNDPVKNKMLAVVRGSDYLAIDAFHATFGNQPVSNSDLLIRYTYYGDANLNGKVDGGDYARIDTSFNNEHAMGNISGWINGDFDYNGKVDGADYALLDAAFSSQTTSLGPPTPGTRDLPEPGSAIVALATLISLSRRHRTARASGTLVA